MFSVHIEIAMLASNKKRAKTCKPCKKNTCIRSSGLLDHTALWVGGLRKVGIDLQLHHIGLDYITKRNPPFEPNYTSRNIENTVGLRQVGIKSLFFRHLCLFEVVSLDLLPLHSQSNRNETHLQKLQ